MKTEKIKTPKTNLEIAKIVKKKHEIKSLLNYLDKSDFEDRMVGNIWEHAQELLGLLQEYFDEAQNPQQVKEKVKK